MKGFYFDFENLKVYQRTLVLIDDVFEITKSLPRDYRYSVGDNLIRAALSIANNLAEGNDKASSKERSRYFRTSSDSARECASVFIVPHRRGLLPEDRFLKLKTEVREITNMLKPLIQS